jgi:hypothetical protein
METVDEKSGWAKALAALVEVKLGDVGDVDFVATAIKSDGSSGLPQTKGIRKLLVLDENGAAFLAGQEQPGVVTDLVGTGVVVELSNDQITLDFDLFRVVWLCFLDDPDYSNLDFGGDDCCLGPNHVTDFEWKVGKECHFRFRGWEDQTIGQGE